LARRSSSTAVQEELYPVRDFREEESRDRDAAERETRARERFDDSRVVDLEADQESPFLRAQKRVSARRGPLPKKTADGLKWAGLALLILAVLAAFGAMLYHYGKHSWRFRIDSSDQIEVSGAQHVTRAQIMEVMGGDIGRNIFFVPLDERQQQIDQIPWVESASVMRFVPNRLRIVIHERTPVAFARVGSHIALIDAGGNLMELSPGPKRTGASGPPGSGGTGGKYSFPVITGMNASEPLSTRAARMKDYNELIRQLDSDGARYSQDISEVDLTDSEDVKVMTADSSTGGVLIHLGNGNYLQRYKIYVTHVEAWRQQFEKLDSVDLRYDGQIIVNPDLQGIARQPALTPAAAKAALAAGVKNAAIVNYEKYVSHPLSPQPSPKPAQEKSKTGNKAAKNEKKTASKAHLRTKPKTVTHSLPKPGPVAAITKVPAPLHPNTAPAPDPSIGARNSGNNSSVQASTSSAAKTTTPASSSAGTQKKPSAAIPKETPQK